MVKSRMPRAVGFALIWLGVFGSAQLLLGLAWSSFPLVVSAGLTGLLLWALALRQRWAFVLTFLVVAVSVVVLVVQGEGLQAAAVFLVDGLVWVPLAIGREWYFPARRTYGPV